jgi:Ser/Thr protein kinase RdoA (MazF antagonist)
MEPAKGTRSLIDLLSIGEIPEVAVTQLPQALGRLHQVTYGKYQTSSLYDNVEFRDFKLKLQYDGVAEKLDPAEAAIVMACKELYQQRQVCVTHGDPNSRNIVIGDGTMGLFDFEQSHLGAPAYDIAYILSEYFIAAEFFGRQPEHIAAIGKFLDSYFKVFDAEERLDVETEIVNHLAVQMVYRFWGLSRASWTFYLPEEDRARVITSARVLLSNEPQPISLLLAGY